MAPGAHPPETDYAILGKGLQGIVADHRAVRYLVPTDQAGAKGPRRAPRG